MTAAVVASSQNIILGLPLKSLSFSTNKFLSMSSGDFGAYDRSKMAISSWVRRTSVGTDQVIMWKNAEFQLNFVSSNQIQIALNAATSGSFVTTATYSSTGSFYHVAAFYDAALTEVDRLKLYVNGSRITEGSYNPPSGPIETTGNAVSIGDFNIGGGGAFEGLIYQHAFFSGTNPSISSLYNAGAPVNIGKVSGLYSLLDVRSDVVTHDAIRTASWANNNGVTSSSTVP